MRWRAFLCVLLASSSARADQLWDERFQSFSNKNWALTAAMGLGIAGAVAVAPEPRPKWRGGVAFDGYIEDHVRAKTPEGRRRAARISDALLSATIAQPFVDSAWVQWARRDVRTGSQMAFISMQSVALSALVKVVTERLLSRERPFVRGCTENAVVGFPTCEGTGNNRSFFSGHTSMSFTGAGLTCAHHGAMPLYGAPWDALACVGALTAATATGLMRIVADEHYATDVITGATLGLLAGFALPMMAHYRRSPEPSAERAAAPLVTFGGAF